MAFEFDTKFTTEFFDEYKNFHSQIVFEIIKFI